MGNSFCHGFQTKPLRYLKAKNLDVKKKIKKKKHKTEQNKQTKKPLAQIFEGGGGRENMRRVHPIFLSILFFFIGKNIPSNKS